MNESLDSQNRLPCLSNVPGWTFQIHGLALSLGSFASYIAAYFFFFWEHLHRQGALGVTKSAPLLSAISDFSFILCSKLETGPGEDIQHKDF